ncbi:MAG: RdgB/HAM1 family non-canonical purine NTP pyrophosphatase [Ginsengibacter sp.]
MPSQLIQPGKKKMNSLIFATNNKNKVAEVRHLLGIEFEIKSLSEKNINIDIPEPFDTLEENAIEKAEVIYRLTSTNCFAEDSGLMVDSLGGDPGVRSARYAGEQASYENNVDKLLFKLDGKTERSATFKTVICLIEDGSKVLFEGTCKGTIIAEKRGEMGFGYDPVFIPDGAMKTFSEMTMDEKNLYSHRKKAVEKFIKYLRN